MEEDNFISKRSLQYFTKPIPSTILFPEKLSLNNFTSTYPLPAAFKEYNSISLKITIHEDVCDFHDKDEDKILEMEVGFFYV